MVIETEPHRVRRNVRLYPWYALSFNAYFWMPIFVLYFLEHMPLDDVLRLEAIYYLAVVLLEVPSGYLADRVGRRPTLLVAATCLVTAYALFVVGSSFAVFAIAQAFLAAGFACNSGADTSLHYDSLATLGRSSEYGGREAIATRNGLLATGAAGLIGGAAGLIDLRLAYALSLLGAVASLGLVLAMVEPPRHDRTCLPEHPVAQLRACRRLLSDRVLGWTFAYAIVMTVLNHVPYEFYQPYIEQALAGNDALRSGTPLASGIHVGLVMIVASAAAALSIATRDRIGYVPALLGATALQVVITLGMGLLLHPAMLLVVLLRAVPRGMTAAPINAAIVPRVGQGQRATFLSLQSLCGRLAFSAFLVGLSFVPGSTSDETWPTLSTKLIVSAAVGGLLLLALAASARRVRTNR